MVNGRVVPCEVCAGKAIVRQDCPDCSGRGTLYLWFSKSIEDVLKEINVDAASGLSEEKAKVRLEKHGANQLISKKKNLPNICN